MTLGRRHFLIGSAASAAAVAAPALAAQGLDAAQLGLKPGAAEDQSARLQRAIEQAARTRMPLFLAPGTYRVGDVKMPAGAQLVGVRGATRLSLTRGPSLLSAEGGEAITLSGLTLDGGNQALPQNRGLLHLAAVRGVRIVDCTVAAAGGNGIAIERCDGAVTGSTITGSADNALYCVDNKALRVTGNAIARAGNGGIRIWQSVKRHDGSVVADNLIEDVGARAGGTGENGNGVNVFRAGGVVVRNNTIRRMAFSAVRGNQADDMQVIGNNCADMKETAMYAEFAYEGAAFIGNIIDTAENGIAVTNFNDGGRFGVVHGNLLRNVGVRRPGTAPEWFGVGIGVEAETACTGNVIENAPTYGIRAGWGPYLRNVTVSGNVVREAGIGIAVSVVGGGGGAVITGNMIAGARLGAVVGMEWAKAVTGDLTKVGASAHPQLTVANNLVR